MQYPPEPILAEAACHALYNCSVAGQGYVFSESFVREVFLEFAESFISGLVSAGDIGKVVARCILSLTLDKVILSSYAWAKTESSAEHLSKRVKIDPSDPVRPAVYPVQPSPSEHSGSHVPTASSVPFVPPLPPFPSEMSMPSPPELDPSSMLLFSKPITVKKFLKTLVNEKYATAYETYFKSPPLTIPASLKDGLVSFTSWEYVESFKMEMINDRFLEKCFHRRIGIVLPLNHIGADLLIPVMRRGPLAAGEPGFTFILIQVKNRSVEGEARFEYAGPDLTPYNCFRFKKDKKWHHLEWEHDYIAIYMELGTQLPEEALFTKNSLALGLNHYRAYPNHMVLVGFDSFKVSSSDPLKSLFSLICRRHVDNVDLGARHDVLDKIDPTRYADSRAVCFCKEELACVTGNCRCASHKLPCSDLCLCCTLPEGCPRNK